MASKIDDTATYDEQAQVNLDSSEYPILSSELGDSADIVDAFKNAWQGGLDSNNISYPGIGNYIKDINSRLSSLESILNPSDLADPEVNRQRVIPEGLTLNVQSENFLLENYRIAVTTSLAEENVVTIPEPLPNGADEFVLKDITQTISGKTIEGGTLNGSPTTLTINSPTINDGTIDGAAITGGTMKGTPIGGLGAGEAEEAIFSNVTINNNLTIAGGTVEYQNFFLYSLSGAPSAGSRTVGVLDTLLHRSAEFIISLSSETEFLIAKILVVHNGVSNVYMSPYGDVGTGSLAINAYSTSVSGDKINVDITPSTTCSFKTYGVLMAL